MKRMGRAKRAYLRRIVANMVFRWKVATGQVNPHTGKPFFKREWKS